MSPGVGGTSSLAGLPVVWHPDCLRHDPDGEVWLGVWEAGTEVPERATVLLDALAIRRRPRSSTATAHDDAAILAVHDAALVEHLATVWDDWEAAGYPSEHGRPRVVPYVFPTAGLLSGLPLRSPSRHPRAGRAVLLRHDDPDRARHVAGGPGRGRRRADRGGSGRRRRASRVRAVPARPATTPVRPPTAARAT